jgi:hypothetical protein
MKGLVSELSSLFDLDTAELRQRAAKILASTALSEQHAVALVDALVGLKERVTHDKSASREEFDLAVAAVVLMHLPRQSRSEGVLHG